MISIPVNTHSFPTQKELALNWSSKGTSADRPRTAWGTFSTVSCEIKLFRALAETPEETISVLDHKHKGGTGCFTLTEQLSQVKIKALVVWVKCKVNASPQPGEKKNQRRKGDSSTEACSAASKQKKRLRLGSTALERVASRIGQQHLALLTHKG